MSCMKSVRPASTYAIVPENNIKTGGVKVSKAAWNPKTHHPSDAMLKNNVMEQQLCDFASFDSCSHGCTHKCTVMELAFMFLIRYLM